MTERSFELAGVRDLREIDFDTGKRLPLTPGEGNECQRCRREHAVVWEVQETTPGRQRLWLVGSGCGPKILEGWSPDPKEISRAKRRDDAQALLRAWRPRIQTTLDLGRVLAAEGLPEWRVVPSPWREGTLALVSGQVEVALEPGQTQPRKQELQRLLAQVVEQKARVLGLENYWLRHHVLIRGIEEPKLTVDDVLSWRNMPWSERT